MCLKVFNKTINSTWTCWIWNDHNQLCATRLVGKCILPYPERPPRIIVIFRKYTPQIITVALEASLLRHLFIFQTIFDPWALSSEIPASRKGVYLFYNSVSMNFSTPMHLSFVQWFSVRNCRPGFYLSGLQKQWTQSQAVSWASGCHAGGREFE